MKRRVIIDLPKGQSGLEVKMKNLRAGLGFNANTMPWPVMAGKMSEPKLQVNSTLRPVPREEANLEAEKDEVAALPTKSGIPDTFKIGGKRHHSGGTPLNLPSDSFIFSDTAKMRIKDPAVLAQFGMPERKNGYTPADIAKKYDINSFKKILVDPATDKLQKQTAELMISNYNLKLAKLAIIQESMKGFPQGIPAVAMPYIEEMEIDPAQFVQMNPGGAQDEQAQTQQGEMDDVGAEAQGRFGGFMQMGGDVDYFQPGGNVMPWDVPGSTDNSIYTNKLPGFGINSQVNKNFIKDQKDAFWMYEKAMRSNDPQLMEQVAQELDKTDIPYSVGWLPWTQQDKLQDMAGILRERKAALEKSKPQYSQFQASDEAASQKADQLYAALLKKYNTLQETNPDSPEAYAAKKQLDYMFKLTRDYKNLPSKANVLGVTLYGNKNQWYKPTNTSGNREFMVNAGNDMRMYSPKEIAQINRYHNIYVPQTVQTTKKTKPATTTQKSTTPSTKTVVVKKPAQQSAPAKDYSKMSNEELLALLNQ